MARPPQAPESLPLEAWQRIIDINLLGIVRSNPVFWTDMEVQTKEEGAWSLQHR